MTEERFRALFSPFGHISSLVLDCNELGYFGFVCYEHPTESHSNYDYGAAAAKAAVEEMHNF